MQRCLNCGAENSADAELCVACEQPLKTPVAAVQGPALGAAAYPGAPEASLYGAKSYDMVPQLEQQRITPRLHPGDQLGHDRYRIKRIVALGGMGAVYEAEDQNLKRPCAVKEMLDTFTEAKDRQQVIDWFRREASMLHDLNHPAIPRVRDSFEEDGRYYLVMDFVHGRNLAEVLEQEGVQPEERVRRWAVQLCDVLSYLHHQGVIFRDLKPANIMIGTDDRVRLIDFGIARSLRAQNIESMVIVTYGFAAPEQLQGQPEQRSDIFSLGATLHRLLTQHDANSNKPMIFNFPPVRALRPDVTPAFEAIIMRALSPRAVDRWTTAGEMGRAIRALPAVTGSLTPPVAVVPASPAARAISRPLLPFEENVNQARAFLEQERWQEALKAARKAVEADRANPLGHKMLGIVYARSRPPEAQRALESYNESLQLNPNDAETYRLIGDVYLFLQQQPQEAMTAYQKAARLNPSDYETHRFLGMCLEQTGQLEYAQQEYATAVRLAPNYVPAHMSYGQLALRLDKMTDAECAFVEALRLKPGLPVARHLLAQVYERQGRMSDALREAEYAVQVDPRDGNAATTLARLRRAVRMQKRNGTRPLF
jgi:serine/threonine protein kinase